MENSIILKDPVCGMAVTEKSFHHLQQDGHTYYFCGEKCKARFNAPTQPLFGRLLRNLFGPDRKSLQGVRPE
jgi:YHS domain-containing protein